MALPPDSIWHPAPPHVVTIPSTGDLAGTTTLGDLLENVLEHNPVTASPHANLIGGSESQVLSLAAGADFVPFETVLADLAQLNHLLATPFTFGPPQARADFAIAKATTLTVPEPGLADHAGDTVQLLAGTAHGGLTLGSADNAFLPSGSFTYTPDATFTGSDGFTVGHSGGAPQSVRLSVTPAVKAAPVANNDLYEKAADPAHATLQVDRAHGVLANDSDPFGRALSAHLVAQPEHGKVVLAADGSFSYTPDGSDVQIDHFTYSDDNGVSRGPAQTAWIATPATTGAPLVHAAADAYTFQAGQPSAVRAADGVLANDSGGGKLAAFLHTLPQHGTVSLAPDGGFEYIPSNNFTGTDHFSYAAADGHGLPALADVTVTVSHDLLF